MCIRVLIVAPYYPLPIRSGGHTRLANLVGQLGRRHHLHWLSLATPSEFASLPELPGLARPASVVVAKHNLTFAAKTLEAVRPSRWQRTVRRLTGRLAGLPTDVVRMDFPELAGRLRAELRSFDFDVIQLEYTALGLYAPRVRKWAPAARLVLEEIDISYVAMERMLSAEPTRPQLPRQIRRMKRFERRLWKDCDAIVTMSDVEREQVSRFIDTERVWSVPNGVDLDYFSFEPRGGRPPRFLFLGHLAHPPNSIGLRFFLEEVWPELHRRHPEAELHVVGDAAPAALRARDGREGIRVRGYVSDVRPLLASCTVLVAPILNGSGTRLKILEAMAAGLPVVSTTLGCEGIEVEHEKEVLLADSAPQILETLSRVIQDPERLEALAQRARKRVERCYGWDSISQKLEAVWRRERGGRETDSL